MRPSPRIVVSTLVLAIAWAGTSLLGGCGEEPTRRDSVMVPEEMGAAEHNVGESDLDIVPPEATDVDPQPLGQTTQPATRPAARP